MVEVNLCSISLNNQLKLLGLNKSSYYYQPVGMSDETIQLLKLIDRTYTNYPTFGTRSMWGFTAYPGLTGNEIKFVTLISFLNQIHLISNQLSQ